MDDGQIEFPQLRLAQREAAQQRPERGRAGRAAADALDDGECLSALLLARAGGARVIEAGEAALELLGGGEQPAVKLAELDRRIANRRDPLGNIGDAAVVEREQRIKGPRRILEIAPHLLVGEEMLP